jgi:hypothetical protein
MKSIIIEHKVYTQLAKDFPINAINWVKNTKWEGPLEVPLHQIDFSDQINWKASHEPKKVNVHAKLIEQGQHAPIILGKIPGKELYSVLDGHHRLLAFVKLGQTPLAYIGEVSQDNVEAALKMHDRQLSGPSKLDGMPTQSPSHDAEEAAAHIIKVSK